jgi:superfamily II DNA helicase RecQ
MSEDRIFRALHPFNRDNLFYEVNPPPIQFSQQSLDEKKQVRYLSDPEPVSQMADVFDFITTLYRRRKRSSSGIIYCKRKATCDELSSYLRTKGLNAKPYHRGLPSVRPQPFDF